MRGEVDRYAEIAGTLRTMGYLVTRMNAGRRPGMRGAPKGWSDFVCCSPTGQFVAVEVKREGCELRPEQLAFCYEVGRRGGLYLVVHESVDLIARLGHENRISREAR